MAFVKGLTQRKDLTTHAFGPIISFCCYFSLKLPKYFGMIMDTVSLSLLKRNRISQVIKVTEKTDSPEARWQQGSLNLSKWIPFSANFPWCFFILWLHSFVLIQQGRDLGFENSDCLNFPFNDSWQPPGWKQLTSSLIWPGTSRHALSVCPWVLVYSDRPPTCNFLQWVEEPGSHWACVCLSVSCHCVQRRRWQVGLMQLLPRLRGCQTSITGDWGFALKSHSELLTIRELALGWGWVPCIWGASERPLAELTSLLTPMTV